MGFLISVCANPSSLHLLAGECSSGCRLHLPSMTKEADWLQKPLWLRLPWGDENLPRLYKNPPKITWNFKNAGHLDKEIWDLESIIFRFHVEHDRILWPWTVVFLFFLGVGDN